MHKHHIIPIHAGGTDAPENLIELTVEEHAEAHRKLYEQFGRWQDKLAWKGLAGIIDREEVVRQVMIETWKTPERRAAVKPWTKERKAAHVAMCSSLEYRDRLSTAQRAAYAANPRPKKGRKSRVTGVGSGNHGKQVGRIKSYIIDGEHITNLRKWADKMSYNYDSIRTTVCRGRPYKGHKIEAAS